MEGYPDWKDWAEVSEQDFFHDRESSHFWVRREAVESFTSRIVESVASTDNSIWPDWAEVGDQDRFSDENSSKIWVRLHRRASESDSLEIQCVEDKLNQSDVSMSWPMSDVEDDQDATVPA